MTKILITSAIREEIVELQWKDFEIGHLRTGIGKMKSAYYLTQAIHNIHPDMVINIGTAGTIDHHIGDIFVCRHFIDRDYAKLADYGLDYEITMTGNDNNITLPKCMYLNNGTCNTGDTFVTSKENISGDITDMEAYAQAFVCQSQQIPFIAVKCVTDIIGQNSIESWQEKITEAVERLQLFLNMA